MIKCASGLGGKSTTHGVLARSVTKTPRNKTYSISACDFAVKAYASCGNCWNMWPSFALALPCLKPCSNSEVKI